MIVTEIASSQRTKNAPRNDNIRLVSYDDLIYHLHEPIVLDSALTSGIIQPHSLKRRARSQVAANPTRELPDAARQQVKW